HTAAPGLRLPEPTARVGYRFHVALAQRARDHHQRRFPGRHADDDARGPTSLVHRRDSVMRKKYMRSSHLKAVLKTATLALTILVLSVGVGFAQSTVNLTATRQTTTLPDGNTVPMWGW